VKEIESPVWFPEEGTPIGAVIKIRRFPDKQDAEKSFKLSS
jgi:hypothetical protein